MEVNRQVRLFGVALALVTTATLVVHTIAAPPAVSSPQPAWSDDYYSDLQSGVRKYNERIDDVDRVTVWGVDLGRARDFFRNERVNLYVTAEKGGTAAYSFQTTDEAKIRDLRHAPRDDATVRIVVERTAVQRIDSEYTQTRAIKHAYVRNDIRVSGVGVNNWVRWWLFERAVRHAMVTAG